MKRAQIVIIILVLIAPASVAQSTYIIGSHSSPVLSEIDAATGAQISTLTLSGFAGQGFTGLAIDPMTGVFFAIDDASSSSTNRRLLTIDTTTGVCTIVGATGLPLGDLAFDQNGTLYAVEGVRIGGAGRLYTLDTTTGAPTLVANLTLSTGLGGTIAVSPFDGLIYRLDGMLSTIDPNAGFVESFIGSLSVEYSGLGFDAGGDLLATRFGELYAVSTTTGLGSFVGFLPGNGADIDQTGLFPSPPSFAGTDEDLLTEASVNAGPFVAVIDSASDTHSLLVGDNITIRHLSPGGTFDFLEFAAFGSIAPIGTASNSPFPGLHFLTGGGVYSLSVGLAGVAAILPPGGVTYAGIHVGGALSGVATLVQAASITGTAANSIFASTNGLLIEFL